MKINVALVAGLNLYGEARDDRSFYGTALLPYAGLLFVCLFNRLLLFT